MGRKAKRRPAKAARLLGLEHGYYLDVMQGVDWFDTKGGGGYPNSRAVNMGTDGYFMLTASDFGFHVKFKSYYGCRDSGVFWDELKAQPQQTTSVVLLVLTKLLTSAESLTE